MIFILSLRGASEENLRVKPDIEQPGSRFPAVAKG